MNHMFQRNVSFPRPTFSEVIGSGSKMCLWPTDLSTAQSEMELKAVKHDCVIAPCTMELVSLAFSYAQWLLVVLQ